MNSRLGLLFKVKSSLPRSICEWANIHNIPSSSMRESRLRFVDLCESFKVTGLSTNLTQIVVLENLINKGLEANTEVKFYARHFDIICMGKWVPRLDTRGAYPIFYIQFDS